MKNNNYINSTTELFWKNKKQKYEFKLNLKKKQIFSCAGLVSRLK